MNKITAVVIESDGNAYSIDVGTSIKELSEAIKGAFDALLCFRQGRQSYFR